MKIELELADPVLDRLCYIVDDQLGLFPTREQLAEVLARNPRLAGLIAEATVPSKISWAVPGRMIEAVGVHFTNRPWPRDPANRPSYVEVVKNNAKGRGWRYTGHDVDQKQAAAR